MKICFYCLTSFTIIWGLHASLSTFCMYHAKMHHTKLLSWFIHHPWIYISKLKQEEKDWFAIYYLKGESYTHKSSILLVRPEHFFSVVTNRRSLPSHKKLTITWDSGISIYANSPRYQPNVPLSCTSPQISQTRQIKAHKIFLTSFDQFFFFLGRSFFWFLMNFKIWTEDLYF